MTNQTTKFYPLEGGVDAESGGVYFGRVRMFFNNNFSSPDLQNISYNAEVDIQAIKESFEKLHFKVDEPIMNKTAKEMIQLFKKQIDYFGCAVIFVFSHGEKDFIYGTDANDSGGKIDVWNDFYPQFGGIAKPEIKCCPKVFINEWCQNPSDSINSKTFQRGDSNLNKPKHQNTAHWLICNAALPHYPAFADENRGSFFTQTLCRYLNQCAQTKDLEDIFKLVKEEISQIKLEIENGCSYMQPIVSSTLEHKLYLLSENKVDQIRKNNNCLKSEFKTEFEQLDVIYENTNADVAVFKAKCISDQHDYAIKRIQLRDDTCYSEDKILREIHSLSKFKNCLNIVSYKHHWAETCITNNGTICQWYIQMELCEKSLEEWLTVEVNREKYLSLNIFKQIVNGLSFVHKRKLVHGDIKPSNILLVNIKGAVDNCVRLADFGLTRHVESVYKRSHVSASLLYMAPEIFLDKFVTQSDLYSVGLILIELLCNCSGDNHYEILNKSKENEYPSPLQNEMEFAVPVLNQLLAKKWEDRSTCDELLQTISTNAEWTDNMLQLESICTAEKYELNEVFQHEIEVTLSWNRDNKNWLLLSAGIPWEIRLILSEENDLSVAIRYCSVHKQCTTFRAFAVLLNYPLVWMETAGVLRSGQEWRAKLSKNLSCVTQGEFGLINVKMCWTLQAETLPVSIVWRSGWLCKCRWKLHGWSAVNPSSKWWQLWSAAFGRNGVVWRLYVNNRKKDGKRELVAGVQLQGVSGPIKCSRKFKCSLTVWEEDLDVKVKILQERSWLDWLIVDDVSMELRNPLVLTFVLTCI